MAYLFSTKTEILPQHYLLPSPPLILSKNASLVILTTAVRQNVNINLYVRKGKYWLHNMMVARFLISKYRACNF
jgi:hypothetical protein